LHPISGRILAARFEGNVLNVRVIQCYAPTEGTKVVKKQAFHSKLSRVIMDNNKDIKIVTRDLNAKVWIENEGLEHVIG
jgi:hypothetical protein